MTVTITQMAQDLIYRITMYEANLETQPEPELQALTPMQIRGIKLFLNKLIDGEYLDNPLEGG